MKQWKRRAVSALLAAAACVSFAAPVSAGWKKDGAGWWYETEDGWAQNEWKFVDGKWYYFDGSGYMQTGWLFEGGERYYLREAGDPGGPEGSMVTGWFDLDGERYRFGGDGAALDGFFEEDGVRYMVMSGLILDSYRMDLLSYEVPDGWTAGWLWEGVEIAPEEGAESIQASYFPGMDGYIYYQSFAELRRELPAHLAENLENGPRSASGIRVTARRLTGAATPEALAITRRWREEDGTVYKGKSYCLFFEGGTLTAIFIVPEADFDRYEEAADDFVRSIRPN